MRVTYLVLAASLFVWCSPAGAAKPVPGDPKCPAAKLDATSRAVADTLACHKRALADAVPVSADCLAMADAALIAAFDKADRTGGCKLTGDAATFVGHVHEFAGEVVSDLNPAICGDTAGAGGSNVPCFCGDAVITNTVLTASDPVTNTTCPAGGLHVAPGITLNLNGFVLAGSGAGSGINVAAGATVLNGTVRGFEMGVSLMDGPVVLHDVAAIANVGAGLVVGTSGGATAPTAAFGGPLASVSDNGGAGVVIHPGASLMLTGTGDAARLPILNNAGAGIHVQGGLVAEYVEIGHSAGHGVLIETDDPVELADCDVHDSGRHPTAEPADSAGIYALRAAYDEPLVSGLWVVRGAVRQNAGHGIVLGHLTEQTGLVSGRVDTVQIFDNEIGIQVQQKDLLSARTLSTIISNNVYNNRDSGIYMKTSYQKAREVGFNGLVFNDNQVHHNAMDSPVCTFEEGAQQSAAQIVFDGPVATTDPYVPVPNPFTTPITPGMGYGPDEAEYPEDFMCFWGADRSRIMSFDECLDVTEPDQFAKSGGVQNHCVWRAGGRGCRVAWDMGGVEGDSCDSNQHNFIFGYINQDSGPLQTQVGVYARNSALVRARGNTWGAGGTTRAQFADSATGSLVEVNNSCGTRTLCEGY